MATLTELHTFATDTTYQGKVKASVIKAALNIAGEAQGVMTLIVTTKRQELASRILRSTLDQFILTWSLAVASNINSITPTDAQIDTAVAAIWNDMAGVTGQD